METIHIRIKHMVSARSIMLVKEGLESVGLRVVCISLGEAVVLGQLHEQKRNQLQEILQNMGFELVKKEHLSKGKVQLC